MASFDGRT
jgi:hypothetical protein